MNLIGVDYTVFEVMGARDWAWHERGPGWSRWGSVLADKTWGTSGLGREDLGGAGEA